ncbi:MAG: GAF domain-containing protein, partial [bacterium]
MAAKFSDLLSHLSQIMSSAGNAETILGTTVELIKTALEVEGCSIQLLDPLDNSLKMKVALGIPKVEWAKIQVQLGDSISGAVAESGKPIWIKTEEELRRYKERPSERYPTHSCISIPILIKQALAGVINVNSKSNREDFTEADFDLLVSLAGLISLTLENSNLLSASQSIQQRLEHILESLHFGVMTVDRSNVVRHCNK